MPCFTGRSEHTLLKKDCPTGCACCVNATYSCGLLYCGEPKDNVNKPDVARLFFEFFTNYFDENGCDALSDFFATLNDNEGESVKDLFPGFPDKHCRVVINASQPPGGEEIFIIEDLVLVQYTQNGSLSGFTMTVTVNDVTCVDACVLA